MRIDFRPLTILITVTIWILGCVAPETAVKQTPTTPGSVGAEAPQADSLPGSSPQAPITTEFDHKPPYDSVDWATTNLRKVVPLPAAGAREWPGEKLGLIGPIVAHSDYGGRYRFVLVYDPAGVLVGGMTLREFKQNPERFEALLQKAHQRAQHQNRMALRHLTRKYYHELAIEPRDE